MKFTLSWLKTFLNTQSSTEMISEALTNLGLEVESVTDYQHLHAFKIARIEEAKPHPAAEKLQVCQVFDGKERLQIVCGAPNARPNIHVVLAPIGTVIPAHQMTIKRSLIRGVESHGMLCSASELALGEDSEGILELPPEVKPGESILATLGLDDPVFEIAITPNRGDCLGVYGIARDLAAAGLGTLISPNFPSLEGTFDSDLTVSLQPDSACKQFLFRTIRNLKNGESPLWLKRTLQAIGIRPISAVVDITNYIAFSYGQPLHAYDANRIDSYLEVRKAHQGETFEGLNGKTYTLSETMTVIADQQGVRGLGGILGDAKSGCEAETQHIILEAAWFEPQSIAATGRQLQINTDARYRFERMVDPKFARFALQIATEMICELCGGEASHISQKGEAPSSEKSIRFPFSLLPHLGGITLEPAKIQEILLSLGFSITHVDHAFDLIVPSWRSDISGTADIVEEILRIHGYHHVPAILPPVVRGPVSGFSPKQQKIQELRKSLAARGFYETVSFSFISEQDAKRFGGHDSSLVLKNPIHTDLNTLRPSILPSLLRVAAKNQARGFFNTALFEYGPTFKNPTPQGEESVIAAIRVGETEAKNHYNTTRAVDAFDSKADLLALLQLYEFPIEKLTTTDKAPNWYHPGRSGALYLGPKQLIGYFGELHPNLLDSFDLKGPIVGFELLVNNLPAPKAYTLKKGPLRTSDYQAVTRDFAFIVDDTVMAETLIKAVRNADKELIKEVTLFDVYSGKGIEEGKKSLAISTTFQAPDHTLIDEEIEILCGKIVVEVNKATNGRLRES